MASRAAQIEINSISKYDAIFFSNPDIQLFKNVYRRHSNYSKFTHEIASLNRQLTTFNQLHAFDINVGHDLLTNLFLDIEVTFTLSANDVKKKKFYTVNHFGTSLIKKAEFKVGRNILVDSYKNYMKQANKELNVKSNKSFVKPDTIGGGLPIEIFPNNQNDHPRTLITEDDKYYNDMPLIFSNGDNSNLAAGTYTKKFRYYFDFYFCKDSGSSFPLIATRNQTKTVLFSFENIEDLLGSDNFNLPSGSLAITSCKLIGEFAILGKTEQQYFKNSELEYIYLQHSESNNKELDLSTNNFPRDLDLKFNVRDIIFTVRQSDTSTFGPCYFKSLTSESLYDNSKTIDFKFKMNGNDLYSSNYDIKNYTRHFPGKYFNNIPPLDRIGVYSFALEPKNIQPTGNFNFSTLKNFEIDFNFTGQSNDPNTQNTVINSSLDELIIFTNNYNLFKTTGTGFGSVVFV